MAIRKLFIANQNYAFHSLDSTLITNSNYKDIIKSKQVVDCCTSFADLGLMQDNIKQEVYDYVTKSIDLNSSFEWGSDIGYILPLILTKNAKVDPKIIDQIFKFNCDRHLAERTTNDPVLWVAGCSLSSAIGVEPNERWGHNVSNHFNLPEVNIAKGGSSITFAADQILRSDIRRGDRVIWGLTGADRVDLVNSEGEYDSCVFPAAKERNAFDLYTLDYFDSPMQQIQYAKAVKQVVNFCQKIGANLVLANMLCDSKPIVNYLKQLPNYVDFYNAVGLYSKLNFIDTGTDSQHPGPKQHQHYANEIIKCIQGE